MASKRFDQLKDEAACLEELSGSGFLDPKTALNNLKILSRGPLEGVLDRILELSTLAPSPDGALNHLEVISQVAPAETLKKIVDDPAGLDGLVTVCGSSIFLTNIISREPFLIERLFLKGGLRESKDFSVFRRELEEMTGGAEDFNGMASVLRVYKHREYLRIGAKDLLRLSSLEETTAELSDLAGASLDAALAFSLKKHMALYGAPVYTDLDGVSREAEFVVMGLGKLGGRELNFSSDIDIVYIYSSDNGETEGMEGKPESRISLHAFFVKVSMMLSKLISSVTGDGFVFRVDLDLRPEGRNGDMANSLRSAEIYYESWGQTWERAAMLKARPVAGSMGLGEEFLAMIRPFVFRRYLDFTAIEEIKSMKEKIDLSRLRRSPDTIDVKLGVGGIREIEFFCQALQLIHAGKNPDIRERNTLAALDKLYKKGLARKEEHDTLRAGYIFLRDLEHRIQIVDGRQSQMIPPRPDDLERLARMMGFRDVPERKAGEFFWDEYRRITSSVHEIYRSLFYKSVEEEEFPKDIVLLLTQELSEEETSARLKALGFKDAGTACKNLNLLKTGPAFVHLSAKASLLLQRLGPMFLTRVIQSPDADKSLAHLERFLASVGARTTFYSLLAENPKVLEELIRLFGTSDFLSRDLIERPESLDLLLSNELSIPYRKKEDFSALFSGLVTIADYEDKLDEIRRIRNQEVFRIGINDIRGGLTPMQVSMQLTFLAEACLEAATRVGLDELTPKHGEPRGSKFFIIGLGKLGAKELIYGSDLDIIFVYGDGEDGRTTGPREIYNHEFFVKLGQRIISVLTIRTKEGMVFNVDARLRPSGSAGPLVVSKEALLKYHREKTGVWERQAFIKARAVAGDTAFGGAVLEELRCIQYSRPLTKEDASEMLRIRKRMEVEIAKEDASRYNIKTGKGGIVDIEFSAQALQLQHGGTDKQLQTPYALKALSRLKKKGIIPPDEADFLKKAYRFFRVLEMKLRVVHDRPEGYIVKDSEELSTLARRAGYTGGEGASRLIADYEAYSGRVREIYLKTLGSID